MNIEQLTLEEKQEIESILEQAEQWGVFNEVKEWAERFMKEGHSQVEAYVYAAEEWIK